MGGSTRLSPNSKEADMASKLEVALPTDREIVIT